MRRFAPISYFFTGFCLCLMLGAAPAAPSYHLVEQSIQKVRTDWARPGSVQQPNAPAWNALFDATLADLRNYAAGTTESQRLMALDHLYQISRALSTVQWAPALEVREALRTWLRPRVRLAWAERKLVGHLHNMPATSNPSAQGNRDRWMKFVDNELGQSLKRYDAASTVVQRQAALKGVYSALNALQSRNQAYPWFPSMELQSAVNDLYNQPNVDVSVDVNTLAPALNANLVTSGPVERKGYVSQVTAGPKAGFGLVPSDDGIAFYNSQWLTSVTPISDFQQQVQQKDKKGRRAAKMYQFQATSMDTSLLTIMAVLRPTGLSLFPSYQHNVSADISTTPQERGKLARAIAGLFGFNQPRITQLAWEGAIGPMRSNVEKEAMELGLERTSREAAVRNASLAQYLIGGDRVAFRNLLIEGLSLRSRPENALIGGRLSFMNAASQMGADAPQPSAFARPDAGVSADLHLSSIMTNFTQGYLQSDAVKSVENLMVETQKVPPDAPPSQGVKVTRNADYATFLRSVETARAANDPRSVAIRVRRPRNAPEFGVDARGNLVVLINDFEIEVPAPPQAAKGGVAGPPARVYRMTSPQAEFVIAFKVEAQTERDPLRLTGRVEGFDPGPRARVFAVNEDENQPAPLTAFTGSFVMGVFRSKVQGQPIDVPLSNLQLRGFAIQSVSPLDPSGWIRVNLVRTMMNPAPGLQ
ncbi:MAG: hypothetical protein NVSMB9_05560 [Isosphaeraceae bacterium]